MSILRAEKICAKVGGKSLFEPFSASLESGKRLAILAPNGSGKSTLLHILAGLKECDSGKIWLFDDEMKEAKDYDKYRTKIGFLFQESDQQFICADVLNDVCFSLLAGGLCDEKTAKNRSLAMLERLGISHLANKICLHLSGGQKRLVALAGVLVTEPELLLLDEPTAGLDDKAHDLLVEILQSTSSAMIITSHDKNFIEKITNNFCDL